MKSEPARLIDPAPLHLLQFQPAFRTKFANLSKAVRNVVDWLVRETEDFDNRLATSPVSAAT